MPTQGRVRPKSGWRGSTTVTVSSGAGMISSIGVVSWSSVPDSGGSQKDHIGVGAHKREFCYFAHQPFIEGGLKRKIKGIERFAHGKMSRFSPVLMSRVLACFHFQRKHSPQKSIIGDTVNTRLLHQIRQLRFHVFEVQRFQDFWELVHCATSRLK